MAINTYLPIIESKKQKANKKSRDREHFDGCQMGGGVGEWVKR